MSSNDPDTTSFYHKDSPSDPNVYFHALIPKSSHLQPVTTDKVSKDEDDENDSPFFGLKEPGASMDGSSEASTEAPSSSNTHTARSSSRSVRSAASPDHVRPMAPLNKRCGRSALRIVTVDPNVPSYLHRVLTDIANNRLEPKSPNGTPSAWDDGP